MSDHVKDAEGCECRRCVMEREITAYQIAKDNRELRMFKLEFGIPQEQDVYGEFQPAASWQVY